jgi:hypothetical protein
MNKTISKVVPKYNEQKRVREFNYYFYNSISKYYFQLNPFALQILHDNIRISAGGFFTVDMQLFFSVNVATLRHKVCVLKCIFQIISACATYLVVVWQFLHFTDQNCF